MHLLIEVEAEIILIPHPLEWVYTLHNESMPNIPYTVQESTEKFSPQSTTQNLTK